MNASYGVRLLLQCLDSFFFVHLAVSFALTLIAPLGIWCAERIRPASGIRLLLVLRLFPVLAATYAALAIALPSYLRLEPAAESERIGPLAICFAVVGISLWIRPGARTIKALWISNQLLKHAEQAAQPSRIASGSVWLLRDGAPRVAVAGLWRTRVLLSESAIKLLVQDELDVVMRHESAHQQSRDNLKRLLLLLLPDALPFVTLAPSVERACKRLVEWAADDYAVAEDSEKSLALARALVCFARNQTSGSGCSLATSLVDDASDLARRVERLLARPQPVPPDAQTYVASAALAGATAMIFTAIVYFADLPNVHRLLEFLSH